MAEANKYILKVTDLAYRVQLTKIFCFSVIFGVVAAASGILLANYLRQPSGIMVVFSGITIFTITVLVNWRLKLTR